MSGPSELRLVLTVQDFDRSVQFYKEGLGLEQIEDWSSPQGRVVLLDVGRATLEIMDEAQAAMVDGIEVGSRVSGPVRLAVEVEDSRSAAETLSSVGGVIVSDPVETPWGDVNTRIETPNGLQMTLFSTPG